jgi:hypothetical protein
MLKQLLTIVVLSSIYQCIFTRSGNHYIFGRWRFAHKRTDLQAGKARTTLQGLQVEIEYARVLQNK